MSLQQSLILVGRDCHPSFQRYLERVGAAVAGGEDLAASLALDSSYFDGWTISLIRLGEYGNSLSEVFTQLARATEARARRERLERAVNLWMIAIVWSLLILVAVIFNRSPRGFIKPEFWFRSLAIAFLLLGVSFLVSRYSNQRLQQLLRNLPLVGQLVQARSLIHLAQLQLPLSCGVPLLTALELLRNHLPDSVMRANLSSAARQIRRGLPLSHSLQDKLPSIAIQMIRTGEETGNLDSALHHLGEYYERELELRLGGLESSLRPLSLLAFASLVAVVGIRGLMLLLNSLPE